MLKRFARDLSGNVAMITGLVILPLFMSVAVAVDFSELYRAKVNFQAAVDAGALAAAKAISSGATSQEAKDIGEDTFEANMKNLPRSVGTIDITASAADCESNGVVAVANMRHPMFFDPIHKAFAGAGDANFANITTTTAVSCGNDAVEVALVLDNSGSMNDNQKLATLKTAAKLLVNTLHDSIQSSKPDPVKFSLIPFAATVNIGANNENKSWMDRQGKSSIHHLNLNWDEDPNAIKTGGGYKDTSGDWLTRFTLYDEMDVDWDGCVEKRPYPLHTLDTTPTSANPDTKFVPSFAPDMPDDYSGLREKIYNGGNSNRPYCVSWRYTRYGWRCSSWSDGYSGSYHPTEGYPRPGDYDRYGNYIGGGGLYTNGNVIDETGYANNYIDDQHNFPESDLNRHPLDPTTTGQYDDQYKRTEWTWKYFNNPQVRNISALGIPGGPNHMCTTKPLTPLTASKSTATSKIDQMTAQGATDVAAGISWGWRTLSPGEPFTEGRSYDADKNRKIMIVMTDGNNTYYANSRPNRSYYGAFNFSRHEKIFDGYDAVANPDHTNNTFTSAMDEHMVETCQNVKAAGVSIYSIAFNVPNGSSVQQSLQACASVGSRGLQYYNASDNAALLETFQEIANNISEIAITR